jgi:hypothetical protein
MRLVVDTIVDSSIEYPQVPTKTAVKTHEELAVSPMCIIRYKTPRHKEQCICTVPVDRYLAGSYCRGLQHLLGGLLPSLQGLPISHTAVYTFMYIPR